MLKFFFQEHGNESSGSIKGREFADQLGAYQVPPQKEDSAAKIYLVFFLICIVGGGIKVHSTLRPLNGLLCQHRVIMIMEKSVE
jgi:hypothetical protein